MYSKTATRHEIRFWVLFTSGPQTNLSKITVLITNWMALIHFNFIMFPSQIHSI